jgi:hypothetical protein
MNRFVLALLATSLLATAPACSGASAPEEEEATSEDALTQTPAQRAARVVSTRRAVCRCRLRASDGQRTR